MGRRRRRAVAVLQLPRPRGTAAGNHEEPRRRHGRGRGEAEEAAHTRTGTRSTRHEEHEDRAGQRPRQGPDACCACLYAHRAARRRTGTACAYAQLYYSKLGVWRRIITVAADHGALGRHCLIVDVGTLPKALQRRQLRPLGMETVVVRTGPAHSMAERARDFDRRLARAGMVCPLVLRPRRTSWRKMARCKP